MSSDRDTAPLSPAEQIELVGLAGSDTLRSDLRFLRRSRAGTSAADFDEYIRFATTLARMSDHAGRPFRPIEGTLMKL